MTNAIALFLAALILGALLVDQGYFDGQGALFLARRMAGLVQWMAFWR